MKSVQILFTSVCLFNIPLVAAETAGAEPKILHGLRLDPCAGKGVVRLDSLQLKDATGKTLKQWP